MKYITLIQISLKKSLYYRKASLLTILFSCFSIYVLKLFWKAVYINDDEMFQYMAKYSAVSQILSCAYYFNLKLSDHIRNGSISIELLRPQNYIMVLFFENFGEMAGNFIAVAVPVFLAARVLFGLSFIPLYQMLIWLISVSFGFIIMFMIYLISDMICFWLVEAWSFGYIIDALIHLLSGSFLPAFMVTEKFRKVMESLPFIWIYQRPIELYLDSSVNQENSMDWILSIWGRQCIWILGLGGIICILWTMGRKKIIIQGG